MSKELDYVRQLVDSALYAPEHYIDVIVLACAVTHRINDFNSAPRVLSLGLKGSGKSTVLTIADTLAMGTAGVTGVKAMTAPSYVAEFRLQGGLYTPVIDEINHLFGEAGQNGKTSRFYTYLNQGHLRRTAKAQYQENKVPVPIPIFGVAFLAGLGLAAPPDLRERSIILKMKKAPDHVQVADFSDEDTMAEFTYGKRCLASWAQTLPRLRTKTVRGVHPQLTHRLMDVWGPLFAVAQAAGPDWLKRCLVAFERIELENAVPVHVKEDQLVLDYLAFTEKFGTDAGIASGDFAQWATQQEHGAYLSMKPGQFKQFAVGILGPTASFYDSGLGKNKRGWTGGIHEMNLGRARRLVQEIEAERHEASADSGEKWEDF